MDLEPFARTAINLWAPTVIVLMKTLRHNQAKLRSLVSNIDRGVCRNCGIDCEKLMRVYTYCKRRAGNLIERGILPWQYVVGIDPFNSLFEKVHQGKWLQELLKKYPWIESRNTLWEADHVIPLISCGKDEIDNIRTLCLKCHRELTIKLLRLLV